MVSLEKGLGVQGLSTSGVLCCAVSTSGVLCCAVSNSVSTNAA